MRLEKMVDKIYYRTAEERILAEPFPFALVRLQPYSPPTMALSITTSIPIAEKNKGGGDKTGILVFTCPNAILEPRLPKT